LCEISSERKQFVDNQLQEMDLEYLRELGDELYEKEDFFEAIKVFLLITEYFPEDIDSKARLVTCYFGAGLTPLALRQLKELEAEAGGDTKEWLSSMMPGHLLIEAYILSHASCHNAVIGRLEQYFALGEEDLDSKVLLADSYLETGRYQEAIDIYEEILPLIDEYASKLSILTKIVDCFKLLENFNMVKKTIDKVIDIMDPDNPIPEVAAELSAIAYREHNYQEALTQINAYKKDIAKNKFDNDEKKNEQLCIYDIALLAIKLALGDKEWVRKTCYDWVEFKIPQFEDPPTNLNGYFYEQLYDCIRYTQDSDLLLRIADSDFIKKYTPQLEFAYKALVARMLGDDDLTYQHFDKYKQDFKELIEEDGENFEERWEALKSRGNGMRDFEIPDNDPPLAILVDEYIERYGK
jgi:tetratricopeptide (TPR) repeat protein